VKSIALRHTIKNTDHCVCYCCRFMSSVSAISSVAAHVRARWHQKWVIYSIYI